MHHVAFVPPPPLLVPGLVGDAAVRYAPLLEACDAAVADLLAHASGTVVCVGGGSRTTRHPRDAWGTFAGFGLDLTVGARPGGPAVPRLPLSLTVCRWLLQRAGGWNAEVICQEVDTAAATDECQAVGGRLATEVDGSAAWLVAADGAEGRAARACLEGAVGGSTPVRTVVRHDSQPHDVRYLVSSWWMSR